MYYLITDEPPPPYLYCQEDLQLIEADSPQDAIRKADLTYRMPIYISEVHFEKYNPREIITYEFTKVKRWENEVFS